MTMTMTEIKNEATRLARAVHIHSLHRETQMKPLLRALGLALVIAASCPTRARLVSIASGQIDLLNFGPGYLRHHRHHGP